jgi:hypothetical protein
MKRTELKILRAVPVFTVTQLSQYTLAELRQTRCIPSLTRRTEYGLSPYYFAQSKTKALVFTSPYKSLLERLQVIGESKKMFKDLPVSFEPDGMPLLTAQHHPAPDATPSPQLLLRLAE